MEDNADLEASGAQTGTFKGLKDQPTSNRNLHSKQEDESYIPYANQDAYIQEESYRNPEEQTERSRDSIDSQYSDLSLHFICMDHQNEEYCYYSAS